MEAFGDVLLQNLSLNALPNAKKNMRGDGTLFLNFLWIAKQFDPNEDLMVISRSFCLDMGLLVLVFLFV